MPNRRLARTVPILRPSSCGSAFSSTSRRAACRRRFSANRFRCRLLWRRSACAACSTATARFSACRAAQAAGIPFTLSTMSICSIEDVAGAVDKPFWFQLYVMKDRGFVRSLIERAAAAKCSALVLTVDLQILGQRHRDIKNGLSVPPETSHQESDRHRHQAGLGAERGARQAQDVRQSCRLCQRRQGRPVFVALDRRAVRSDHELEGRRVDCKHLAGKTDPQGHSRCRRRTHRGKDRRGCSGGIEPRRPPA